MALHQLSLFLENRPGHLRAPLEALGKAGIDVLTVTLADTAQFGILRLVVRDWRRARQVLEAAGATVKVTEVIPVQVDNRPGGLAAALAAVEEAGLGVEYLYALAAPPRSGRAAVVFCFEDPEKALPALAAAGLRVPGEDELLGSM
jgi:hypothetical protein